MIQEAPYFAENRIALLLKNKIRARIFVTGKLNGKLSIHFNGIEIGCISIKINSQIDTTIGEQIGSGKIKELNAIDAELELSKKIPAESFSSTRELGRFVLYSGKEFAGIGIVL